MSVSPLYLLGVVLASIALLILLINWRAKMHPFMALMVVSVLAALAAGSRRRVPETIAEGAGGVLGETGIVVFLGAMLGRLLADTGAVSRIADLVIAHSRPKTAPWLVTGVSFLIGVPMFFEVGMVVVLPVLYAVALRLEVASGRPRTWWVRTIVPAIAALSCLHGMLPPHPGPVAAVTGLHADMGLTILLGVICAVPTVIIAGPLYAFWIAPRVSLEPASELIRQFTGVTMDDAISASETGGETTKGGSSAGQSRAGGSQTTAIKATLVATGSETGRPVSTALAMICVLIPVFLMLAHTVTELAVPGSAIDDVAAFAGSPVIAMLIGVLVTCATLAVQAGMSGQQIRDSFGKGLSSIAGVVLIIAGGGAFNAVLKASGIGDAITDLAGSVSMNPLLLGWLIGLVLSFCTGSATVGIVSATGILAPMVTDASPAFVSLLVIAIGCGSISLNWVNHSGFWFIKEAFGMTIGQATKTHMTVQTIVSVVGFAAVWVLSLFLT